MQCQGHIVWSYCYVFYADSQTISETGCLGLEMQLYVNEQNNSSDKY